MLANPIRMHYNKDMIYEEVMHRLDRLGANGSVYGTERVVSLLNRIGSPDEKMHIVHIAGTNGKGSTATMISSVLREAGHTVGLFTSPAVFERKECYLVNGELCSDEQIARSFSRVLERATETTAFETEFCCALALFADMGCDYAVVECGLGGLQDATNAVRSKDVAVLTSVSLDHTNLLGTTLSEMARQKVGIVKDCPLVTGKQSDEVTEVLRAYDPVVAEEYRGELSLQGKFQNYNAGVARATCRLLGIGESAIAQGLKKAYLRGRNEHIPTKNGLCILDGAHNEGAALRLRECIADYAPVTFFIGMFQDKAVEKVLSILLPLAKKAIILQAPKPRGMDGEELCRLAKRYCSDVKIGDETMIQTTLSETGTKVVCGSFSILSGMRRWIDGQTESTTGNL